LGIVNETIEPWLLGNNRLLDERRFVLNKWNIFIVIIFLTLALR
jgi:hypothetical protein